MGQPFSETLAAHPIDDVDAALEDGVLTLRLARPEKKNALTAAMCLGLATTLERVAEDESVGAVLLSGSGGVFSAGADLTLFAGDLKETTSAPLALLRALHRSPVPVVAAVEGDAVGVGVTLLLHCDFVYAGPTARFITPFIDLGLCPEGGSSLLLSQRVGPASTRSLLMLGDPLDAPTAAEAGLVDKLGDAPVETAMATARRLAAKPRAAMRATKRLLREAQDEAIEAVLTREATLFAERLQSPEAQAAFAAFLAKRGAGA